MDRKAGLGIVQQGHTHDGLPCLSCGVPVHREDSICGSCGKSTPPPGAQSYFELLGLEEHYAMGEGVLEERFHTASRATHPDRFANAAPAERRVAVQRSTLLNDAYRTLREPTRRAVYLLQRAGAWAGEQQGSRDPVLLMEVMEGRERVEELKASLREGHPEAPRALAGLRAEVEARLQALHAGLNAEFVRFDGVTERTVALAALVGLVERLRYFTNTKAQLDQLSLQYHPNPQTI